MNTTYSLLLILLAAGALAQLQNDYYFIMPTDCDTPRLFDYAYQYEVPQFRCSPDLCLPVFGGQGTNMSRTTVCESSLQVSGRYMSLLPCKKS
jgi:hypothetical protein